MDKVSFLQEKSSYHMKYPERSDLSFYKFYTEQHPGEAIGWYHLGREREIRGDTEAALAAYQRALHAKPGAYTDEARDSYQTLLRAKRRRAWQARSRLTLASLLFLFMQFAFSPKPLTEPPQSAFSQAIARQPADSSVNPRPHAEVVAVPPLLTAAQLQSQLRRYVESRRPSLNQPYTVIAVPEVHGSPLYTPLLFYSPLDVRGYVRFDPVSRTILSEKWYEKPGKYDQDTAIQSARGALAEEQQTLQHVLTLRNALYRAYQRKGTLPAQLSDLAGAYPGNTLPQIPVPPAGLNLQAYTYRPDAFRPEAAWASMSAVVPLPGYPEPFVPLEPLQLHLYEGSHRLEVTSGPHLVRSYPVGIGKDGLTPEGYFTILRKISHPRGHDNIYGTRGMVFQNDGYAIHGTNHPESIGGSVSLGCIRLINAAVDEMYSFVSLGTELIISDGSAPERPWRNAAPFVLEAGPEEETPDVVYRWLH